jgi:YHS domain-containing protein
MPTETKVEDVVCGMMVEPDSYRFRYQGSDYAFCSAQCIERFEAHPHLYVGKPGHPAPKKQGLVVLKQRRFVVDGVLDAAQAKHLQAQINAGNPPHKLAYPHISREALCRPWSCGKMGL